MAKFVIECPSCGKYAEARTGFFARKKIDCSCGHTINIRTEKLASRECPHCGNQVVFDQTKGEKAICPVCHEKINTMAQLQELKEFSCAQCGVKLRAAKSAATFICPVCDHVNDVQERIMSEAMKKDGLASIIKYEGDNNTFIWKHPVEDFNFGSQLIVHESQEAIFFKDGQALDLFGPGRHTLTTQQLPLLEKVYRLPTGAEGTFHSEVYFINKTVQPAIKWGTPEKVRFIDPLTGTPLEIGASGSMNLQVSDARRLLLKLVGTTKGISWEDGAGLSKSLQTSFRPMITGAVKTNLSAIIKREAIDLLEIDEKLDILSAGLKEKILPGFEEYGLTIPEFYVTSIVLPEEDPNFKRIRELHAITLQTRLIRAEATIKTAQAQGETEYRTAQEQSKAAIEAAHREAELQRQLTETEIARHAAERTIIEAQAQAQAQRIAGLTEAEIMRAKGYTQKDVLQADVQKAYAEGIGHMGSGGNGSGSGLTGDVLGLGVGMAMAGMVAPQIGNMMQGFGMPAGSFGTQASNLGTPASGLGMPASGLGTPAGGFGAPAAAAADAWDCSCGMTGIKGNFCSHCGAKRPVAADADTWDCSCGMTDIKGNFCSHCGAKRPVAADANTWDCDCGMKGNTGNFCNNCGRRRE